MKELINHAASNRYSKQMKISHIGTVGQQNMSQFRCAIIGLGALGSVIAEQLARAGFGYLRIIDRDFVEESNLQRQILYTEQDAIDMLPKAIAAKQYLHKVNSDITIDAIVADVTASNVEELLHDVHIIIDGSDNFTLRYLINEYSVAHSIPWIHGAVVGTSGTTATFLPKETACYACLFPSEPQFGAAETCDTAGVISPIVHIIASIQVTEVMKLATGHESDLHNTLMQLDCWNNEELKLDISHAKRSDCKVCSKHEYNYLHSETEFIHTSSLCGRNSVQVTTNSEKTPSLNEIMRYYEGQFHITSNRYLMKLSYDSDLTVVFFSDGRAIVQGTEDLLRAESIVSQLLQI